MGGLKCLVRLTTYNSISETLLVYEGAAAVEIILFLIQMTRNQYEKG
jgi:hypothetical protein